MTASTARVRAFLAGRRFLVMADQVASSGRNILVAVLVARSFDSPVPFGAFTLAMVAYQLALVVVRSAVGHPMLSLYSPEPASIRRRLVPDMQGATLFVGLVGAVVLWGTSVGLGGLVGSGLAALALVLPGTLVQDTWRFVFAIDRPGAGLLMDLFWLGAVGLALMLAPPHADVSWFILAWGCTGGLAAVLGLLIHRGGVGLPHPWRWLVDHRTTAWRFLSENATAQALGHVLMSALGAIAGLATVGGVRATQVFFGPLNTLYDGVYMAVVPEGAAVRHQPQRLYRKLRRVSVLLVALVAAWMLVGLGLPDGVGEAIFGPTWHDAQELMVPAGLAALTSAVVSGALLGLRSLADAKRSLRARLRSTPWLGITPLVGAVWFGPSGFLLGTALGTAIAAAIWWTSFTAALADVEPAPPGDDREDGDRPVRSRQSLSVPPRSTTAWG